MPRQWLAAFVPLTVSLVARGEDWPGFRGPTGQGISAEKGLPTHWSTTDQEKGTAHVSALEWRKCALAPFPGPFSWAGCGAGRNATFADERAAVR